MQLTERQQKEVNKILDRKRASISEITILTNNTKFKVGDIAVLVKNIWGEYFEKPKLVLILAVYSQMNSIYGDYPEAYIIEHENGKIDYGFLPKDLLRKEDIYGY